MKRTMPLDWHRECLANATHHVRGLRRDAERRAGELAQSEHEIDFYAQQITAAERAGKAEFDRDRFLVKRGKQ